MAARHPEIRLTTINPGLVLGRPLDRHYGTSLAVIERVFSGRDPVVPDVGFPVVDIVDVSRMHVEALKRGATEGRRYMAAAGWASLPEIARWLNEVYPDRKIPTRVAPRWLLTVIGLYDRSVRSVRPVLGRRLAVSSVRAVADMKIQFTAPRDSVLRTAEFLAGRSA